MHRLEGGYSDRANNYPAGCTWIAGPVRPNRDTGPLVQLDKIKRCSNELYKRREGTNRKDWEVERRVVNQVYVHSTYFSR